MNIQIWFQPVSQNGKTTNTHLPTKQISKSYWTSAYLNHTG